MKKNTIRTGVAVGLAVTIAVALFAYTAGAARMLRAQPTAVATVNLSKVLEGLEERGVAERALETLSLSFKAQDDAKVEEIKAQEQQLTDIVDSAAKAAERDKLELRKLQHLAWQRVKVEQLDIEQSLQLQDLYKKITTAIAELAQTEGYDLVVVDDSSTDFSYNPEARVPRDTQTRQQIIGRRVLWRNDAIDITDALIQRMNNAYKAAAGKASATNTNGAGPRTP